jgi:uncharacterized protein
MRPLLITSIILLTQSFSFGQNKTTSPISGKKPFVLGVVETIDSEILQQVRQLNIYLPEGYCADSAKTYPVIYLLDGSADEDFIHVAGLVQFANYPWVDLLPPSIVVGIENIDRKNDFTFPTTIDKDLEDFPTTGDSQAFINFLEKEVQPFIGTNYKVNNTRMLIGQSLGGLLACEILYKKPYLFNQYFIISPSLWWDNESLFDLSFNELEKRDQQEMYVFVAVGKEGHIMRKDARRFYHKLHRTNVRTDFQLMRSENHASILHNAIYIGFERMKKAVSKK